MKNWSKTTNRVAVMNIQMKLKQKIQILLILVSAIIYLVAIGYISINARQTTYRDTRKLVDTEALSFARQIEGQLNTNMAVARTLALSFSNYDYMPKDRWLTFANMVYADVFPQYEDFYNLWDSWELSVIDSSWTKPYGRIVNEHFRDQGMVRFNQSKNSLDGDNELYAGIKEANKEIVFPLYFDLFAEGKSERKLMTSLLVPIRQKDGQYAGVVGVDITMDRFQEMLRDINIKGLDGSYAFLLSHQWNYAAHPDTSMLNEQAAVNPTDQKQFNLHEKLGKGNPFSIIHKDDEYHKNYVSYVPIKIGRTGTPWYLGISVPVNSIMQEADRNFIISLIVGLLGLLILSGVIYYITRGITQPIEKVTGVLKQMARGRISNSMKLAINTGDEIEEMSNALNTSIDGLNHKNQFAAHLGKGELDHPYQKLSEEDELGQSLLEMRDSLKKAKKDEQKRREEERKRLWTNEGLNKFADILRQNNEDPYQLTDELIKNLVRYLEANQGGIFLIHDQDENDVHLELAAAFAYDRKKHLEKRIDLGDGLVGTCAIEKETIYMEDIPQDYIEITSGLGEATPDSLVIVPIKLEDTVHGVIEIASFNTFEQYQIDFLERVAQNIASAISSVKVNMRTQKLLEQSEQQAQELSAQEEEMRQNMEELKATQEEAARQKDEMESLVNAFHKGHYIVEYDPEEKIIEINNRYLELLDLRREDVIGTHHSYKMKFTSEQEKNYKAFWDDLRAGRVKQDTSVVEHKGKRYVFAETYTPILNGDNQVKKILKIAIEAGEFGLNG